MVGDDVVDGVVGIEGVIAVVDAAAVDVADVATRVHAATEKNRQ